jgi:predicted DNA-binding transcriptional regulator AlpA
MRKPNISQRKRRDPRSSAAIQQGFPQLERRWVTGPTLRKMLNISSVTLWRWRHRESSGFPAAKSINGRLYFYWPDVQAWLDKQSVAA